MGKIVILGATGMLGSSFLNLPATQTENMLFSTRSHNLPRENWFHFDARGPVDQLEVLRLGPGDLIVNCIGLIKTHIDSKNFESVNHAIDLNSLLPIRLAKFAEEHGCRVLQIATDCVYSGLIGGYDELAPHDAFDVYGKSKSLGEINSPNFMNLRVSIIGPEVTGGTSLVEWVKKQPRGSRVTGYVDHRWNGVTASTFVKIALGIATRGAFRAGTYHLVPDGIVTKNELVRLIAIRVGREDLAILPGESGAPIDRSLGTLDADFNDLLWQSAGYQSPPSISDMVKAMPLVSALDLNGYAG